MKKQVILDEEDIKQLHKDAEHLKWLYQRMIYNHDEDFNVDYMRRFAKIISKLEEL